MCLGTAMQVLRSDGLRAECEADGRKESVDLSLLGAAAPGDWLLVFLGAARERLSPERAAQIRDAHAAVVAAMRGEAPGAFADLGTPALPPHLEAAHRAGAKEA